MPIRVAINGFGRIGRLVLRALVESGADDIAIVAVNDLASDKTLAHLLKYDSVHGRIPAPVKLESVEMFISSHKIAMLSERDPARLPWKALDVDIVMECTGFS